MLYVYSIAFHIEKLGAVRHQHWYDHTPHPPHLHHPHQRLTVYHFQTFSSCTEVLPETILNIIEKAEETLSNLEQAIDVFLFVSLSLSFSTSIRSWFSYHVNQVHQKN